MNLVKNQDSIAVLTDKSFRLTSKPDADLFQKITSALKKENAVSRIDELNLSYLSVKSIGRCPVCQSKGDFIPRDDACFVAKCQNNDCKLIWEAKPSNNGRVFISKIEGNENKTFKYSGRWSMMFTVS
jgi:hypothetical protein